MRFITMETIYQAVLHQPKANRRVAYVFDSLPVSGEPKEVAISEKDYDWAVDNLPAVYHESGYVKFDIDAQVEWWRQELYRELDEVIAGMEEQSREDYSNLIGTGQV